MARKPAAKTPTSKSAAKKHPRVADCVFCKIVAGEIPAYALASDAKTLAFMDINPWNEGHALAVAKGHYKDLYETPPEIVAAVMKTAKRVALAVDRTFKPEGLNIVQANGPAAGQSQHHFHVHILPRRMNDRAKLNWDLSPGDPHAIEAAQKRIIANLK